MHHCSPKATERCEFKTVPIIRVLVSVNLSTPCHHNPRELLLDSMLFYNNTLISYSVKINEIHYKTNHGPNIIFLSKTNKQKSRYSGRNFENSTFMKDPLEKIQ